MSFYVILQPHGKEYRELVHTFLTEKGLCPKSLDGAREEYLDENGLQLLLQRFRGRDFIITKRTHEHPFVLIELDLDRLVFGPATEFKQERIALAKLLACEDLPMPGLSTELLFRGRQLREGKRDRMARLSDVAFWVRDDAERNALELLFPVKLEEAA